MKLSIVYDNEANEGFINDWGFSCLIETEDWKVLFDTGASGEILIHNLQLLGIQKEDIDIIALSHKHWDHIGGLRAVLHPGVAVCLPSSFPLGLEKYVAKKQRKLLKYQNQRRSSQEFIQQENLELCVCLRSNHWFWIHKMA